MCESHSCPCMDAETRQMRSSIKITHIHLLPTDKMQTSVDTMEAKVIPHCGLKIDLKALCVPFLWVVLLMC